MWQLIGPKKERRKTNSYAVTLGRWYKVLENPVALLSVNHSSVHFHLVLNRFRFIKRMFSWFYLIKKNIFPNSLTYYYLPMVSWIDNLSFFIVYSIEQVRILSPWKLDNQIIFLHCSLRAGNIFDIFWLQNKDLFPSFEQRKATGYISSNSTNNRLLAYDSYGVA